MIDYRKMLSIIFCGLLFCLLLFWGTFYDKGSVAQAINDHCFLYKKELPIDSRKKMRKIRKNRLLGSKTLSLKLKAINEKQRYLHLFKDAVM